MTNGEKWAKEIRDIGAIGFSVAICNNKPAACDLLNCSDCDAYDNSLGCDVRVIEWAVAEYKEPMVEVINAKWVKDNYSDGYVSYSYYYCSHCKTENKLTAYCPHCGARMDEVSE